jgi:hypothetical protein
MNSLGSSDSFCWKLNENRLITNSDDIAYPTSGCCQKRLWIELHNTLALASNSSSITSLMWWLKNLLTCTMHCYSVLAETGRITGFLVAIQRVSMRPIRETKSQPRPMRGLRIASGRCARRKIYSQLRWTRAYPSLRACTWYVLQVGSGTQYHIILVWYSSWVLFKL